MALRVGTAVVLASAVSAAGSWWLSGNFSNPWWLLAFVALPAVLAALWSGQRDGRRAMVVTGVAAVAMCATTAWLAWLPEPAIFGALRAHESGATAAAHGAIGSKPNDTCVAPSATDLGPLAALGPWDKVCVYSYGAEPGSRSIDRVEYKRPAGSDALGLTYATTTPGEPETCVHRVTGDWWAVRAADGQHPEKPCPNGFEYLASG